jgi:glycosyltransferase involved in cell wall biosynthesis
MGTEQKFILIIYDNNNTWDISKHTDNLSSILNADILAYTGVIPNQYTHIIWQNVLNNMAPKLINQKYTFVVHSDCMLWSYTQKSIMEKNLCFIDNFVFTNDLFRKSFVTSYKINTNCFTIEPQALINLGTVHNAEIPGLFLSFGHFDASESHLSLISEFAKLKNINNKLEIHGVISDKKCYDELNNYILKHKITNVKLFVYDAATYLSRLTQCEYFCVLSHNDNNGYALQEAIQLNKKIICSTDCLITENIKWYPNKYIYKPNDNLINWFQTKVEYMSYQFDHFRKAFINICCPKIKKYGGTKTISSLKNVLNDLEVFTRPAYKSGYSILLRIKNEKENIVKCVLDLVDLVDEIIIVDNGSTDGTLKIVNELEKLYDNIYVYQYNIKIPRYGIEHAKNYASTTINSHNTLKNYYNWTESKATYDKKIKWDGDFYCIRHNFKKMLSYFKDHSDQMAVHFSGLTLFMHQNKQYIKTESYYNEYRMFLNNKPIWNDNYTHCGKNYGETSLPFSKEVAEKYFINYPVFVEIKLTSKDEFVDSRSNLINDARDNIDYMTLKTLSKNGTIKNAEPTGNIFSDLSNYKMKCSNYNMAYSTDGILKYDEYVKKYNPTGFLDRIHKFYKKKSILLIIDSFGWAFDNISKQICKYNQEYDITVCTYPELQAKICHNYEHSEWRTNYNYAIVDLNKQYNAIVFFWYGGENVSILDFFTKKRTNNIYLCLYDYSLWVNNTNASAQQMYKNSLDIFIKHISGILYASPHILNIFEKNYPNFNKKKFMCYDGVDTDLFKYVPYNDDIYTKPKLTVGWIGNSNPKSHGINKGFELIKRSVESMNTIFTFMPQDAYTGTKICHNDIPNYLSKVDVIICFSTAEGTPNQILEASASGKCWISTNVGIVGELNNNKYGPSGIIIDRSERELKKALLKLYNNRNILVNYGNNGRKSIENGWIWEQKVKQFYDFFDSTD